MDNASLPKISSPGFSRRDFLKGAGIFIGTFLAVSHLKESQFGPRIKEIGELVNLSVGQRRYLPAGRGYIQYSGNPDQRRFLLTHGYSGTRGTSTYLYLPVGSGQLTIDKYQFSVESVNPENLILKYLGVQQV